eukprot:2725972-Amphidinium_carterae.1
MGVEEGMSADCGVSPGHALEASNVAASADKGGSSMRTGCEASVSLGVDRRLMMDCRGGPGLDASPMHIPANLCTGRNLGVEEYTD